MFEKIYTNISDKEKARAMKENTYIKDGLMYCGNCNTPKQIVLHTPFGTQTVFCLCKCREEECKAEEKAFAEKQKQIEIDDLRKECFKNSMLAEFARFENAENNKYVQAAKRYCDNFSQFLREGKGIIFYGEPGTGKTFIAGCIANDVLDKAIPVKMITVSDFANSLLGTYQKQELYAEIETVPLLVVDDLCTERDTQYMEEIKYNIINRRYQANLPTIITTNMSLEELQKTKNTSEERLVSRMLEMCYPIRIEDINHRRANGKMDYMVTKAILGV